MKKRKAFHTRRDSHGAPTMAIEADILIIGGGIVGLGTAFSLLEAGYAPQQLILVESSSDLLSGASGGNSGILHTGIIESSYLLTDPSKGIFLCW